MNRPALQKLLSDIRDRLVDVVVVYKVDRLTRSLADFAKLVELFDLKRVVLDHANRFSANEILIEDKASGTQLIQDLQHAVVVGVRPYKAPPNTDKIMRLHAQTAKFESGKVVLPKYAPWLFDYLSELTGFPGTRYDDQVDSTTQVLDYLNAYHSLEIWVKLAGG